MSLLRPRRRRKATSIEDLRLLVATVTAEGIFKQKPGCRPVDVNNKAGKASALSEEWLKESATTDIGKEAKLAGQVLLEMLALAGSISESCRAAVGDVETAAHWKTTINSFSKDNAKTCIATMAEKLLKERPFCLGLFYSQICNMLNSKVVRNPLV